MSLAPPPPAAMAWRPERERRHPLFIDWAYFKFFAPGVQGVVVYGCAWGLPGVQSVQLFRRGSGGELLLPPTVVVRQDYGRDEVWRSTASYDCRLAGDALATRPDGFAVTGEVADEREHTFLTWDLAFERLTPAVAAFDYRGCGFLPGGYVGWNLLAPLARVTGHVGINGERLEVDGKGYADTNWGRWLFALDPTTHWNWFMAYEDSAASRLGVVGMNFRRAPRRGALLVADGAAQLRFPCHERTFVHRRFERDRRLGIDVPVETEVTADDGAGNRLALTLTNEAYHVYRQAVPPAEMRGPIPTLVEWALVENFITATGTLTTPAATRPITLRGIKEYPVTRLAFHR